MTTKNTKNTESFGLGVGRVRRNVYRVGGRYKVVLTRRPGVVYGGMFDGLEEAVRRRDWLEGRHAANRPWSRTARVAARRTAQVLGRERRAAGLCKECGQDRPEPGRATCEGCLAVRRTKRRYRAETERLKAKC